VKLSQSLYDLFEQHPELLDGQSWDQEAFDALSYEDQVYMLRDILAKAQASGENYVPMSAFLMTDGNGDFTFERMSMHMVDGNDIVMLEGETIEDVMEAGSKYTEAAEEAEATDEANETKRKLIPYAIFAVIGVLALIAVGLGLRHEDKKVVGKRVDTHQTSGKKGRDPRDKKGNGILTKDSDKSSSSESSKSSDKDKASESSSSSSEASKSSEAKKEASRDNKDNKGESKTESKAADKPHANSGNGGRSQGGGRSQSSKPKSTQRM